jgi:hypothetical protein
LRRKLQRLTRKRAQKLSAQSALPKTRGHERHAEQDREAGDDARNRKHPKQRPQHGHGADRDAEQPAAELLVGCNNHL